MNRNCRDVRQLIEKHWCYQYFVQKCDKILEKRKIFSMSVVQFVDDIENGGAI